MVGGIIEDFYTLSEQNFLSAYDDDEKGVGKKRWAYFQEKSLYPVRFLVRETPPHKDTCCLMVAMPKSLIDKNLLVRNEDRVWWQNGTAYMTIADVADQPFERIGSSGGDRESFLRVKNKHLAS